MLDLEEKYLDLESRVRKLEAASVSGVPHQSIAERFDVHYTRISQVGKNVNARITREAQAIRAEMRAGFAKVDKRFEQVDQRLDQVDKRFEQVDQRLDQVDQRFEQVDKRFEQVDQRLEQIDQRLDQVDQRFVEVDHRIASLATEVKQLKSETFQMGLTLTKIDSDSERRDLRIDKIEQQLGGLEALLVKIDARLSDQQAG
ncbi:hypothetical protein [Nonomuraea sp. NPDC049309]|uniref:hypothetical protein n=1 Tax=Nonomuraea sp. NPDC049309 TaxID=3364350 RepID=UPI00371ACE1E